MRHIHDSIARPRRVVAHTLSDSAIPRKSTQGRKLTGGRYNRATTPVVRYVATRDSADRDTTRANTWRNEGLRAHSDTVARLYT